jgi:hypothetical protein
MQHWHDITDDEIQQSSARGEFDSLPVLIDHKGPPVGRVTRVWSKDGRWRCALRIDLSTDRGREALHRMRMGTLRGLSLSHDFHTRKPVEISLCVEGARPGTELTVCASKRMSANYPQEPSVRFLVMSSAVQELHIPPKGADLSAIKSASELLRGFPPGTPIEMVLEFYEAKKANPDALAKMQDQLMAQGKAQFEGQQKAHQLPPQSAPGDSDTRAADFAEWQRTHPDEAKKAADLMSGAAKGNPNEPRMQVTEDAPAAPAAAAPPPSSLEQQATKPGTESKEYAALQAEVTRMKFDREWEKLQRVTDRFADDEDDYWGLWQNDPKRTQAVLKKLIDKTRSHKKRPQMDDDDSEQQQDDDEDKEKERRRGQKKAKEDAPSPAPQQQQQQQQPSRYQNEEYLLWLKERNRAQTPGLARTEAAASESRPSAAVTASKSIEAQVQAGTNVVASLMNKHPLMRQVIAAPDKLGELLAYRDHKGLPMASGDIICQRAGYDPERDNTRQFRFDRGATNGRPMSAAIFRPATKDQPEQVIRFK